MKSLRGLRGISNSHIVNGFITAVSVLIPPPSVNSIVRFQYSMFRAELNLVDGMNVTHLRFSTVDAAPIAELTVIVATV